MSATTQDSGPNLNEIWCTLVAYISLEKLPAKNTTEARKNKYKLRKTQLRLAKTQASAINHPLEQN